MSASLIAALVWVFASVGVAMLPIRRQFLLGGVLLFAAPCLLVWIGLDHNWWAAGLGLLAFVSMFRNPLIYLYHRANGRKAELPK